MAVQILADIQISRIFARTQKDGWHAAGYYKLTVFGWYSARLYTVSQKRPTFGLL